MALRKSIKTSGAFLNEEAAMKLLYLALRNVSAKWESIQFWAGGTEPLYVLWEDRIQAAMNE